jgi:hypothetical protein
LISDRLVPWWLAMEETDSENIKYSFDKDIASGVDGPDGLPAQSEVDEGRMICVAVW